MMKNESLLVLLRLDAQRLYERIKYRQTEYMTLFSLKRTRGHFKYIFKNRYEDIPIDSLRILDSDLLEALDYFYHQVDEMRWYLYFTEDMPGKVSDFIDHYVTELDSAFEQLQNAFGNSIDDKNRQNLGLFEEYGLDDLKQE